MAHRDTILIVDDTEINRFMLADMLSDQYDILEAGTGVEAVEMLSRYEENISLVLLDIVMPEMDGFEVLAVMNRNKWIESTPVMMISAENSSTYIDNAYELGATDYITRPFDEGVVRRRVHNTIMLYAKQKALQNMVTEQVMEKERNNAEMVEILSNIVEFRNGESGLHVVHIRVITNLLLQCLRLRTHQYDLTPARIALIANASAMHDIGKISIDEHILNKPGRLTREEFEVMKTHSAIGARIIEGSSSMKNSELLRTARDICRWHHERYDGRGYPDGLKGDEIPISAQVVALADVYDALTSERVYKPAFSHEKALQMIVNGECGVFNPLLLECLQENSDLLARELKERSSKSITAMEIHRITFDMMKESHTDVSDRTLVLLEQERAKCDFFAATSREILFEYNAESQLLELGEWGSQELGVPQIISRPWESEDLSRVGWTGFREIFEKLRDCITVESPVFTQNVELSPGGEKRCFRMEVRPLWEDEETAAFTRIIGRLIELPEAH